MRDHSRSGARARSSSSTVAASSAEPRLSGPLPSSTRGARSPSRLRQALATVAWALTACSLSTASPPSPQPPEAKVAHVSAPHPASEVTPLAAPPPSPAPASAAVEAACEDYAAGYCEYDDNDVYADFETMPGSGRRRVLQECWADLRDASADEIATFAQCADCNGNCIDQRDCLGGEVTGVMRYTADCPDDDLQ